MRGLYDNVQIFFLGLILKKTWQSLYSQQRVLISELNLVHVFLETGIDYDGNLEEFQRVCSDMIKFRLLFLLDEFLEGANRLGHRDFDGKDVASVTTIDETVEFEERD